VVGSFTNKYETEDSKGTEKGKGGPRKKLNEKGPRVNGTLFIIRPPQQQKKKGKKHNGEEMCKLPNKKQQGKGGPKDIASCTERKGWIVQKT